MRMPEFVRPKRPVVAGAVTTARDLRRRMTPSETVLWAALRNGRLAGLKFRRQHPIDAFVVDFCCPAAWLVVEVDGGIHGDQRAQDEYRTERLGVLGYRVIRVRN